MEFRHTYQQHDPPFTFSTRQERVRAQVELQA